MKTDFVSVVEASYRLDVDDAAWLAGVAQTIRPAIDNDLGVIAWFYDATARGELRISGFVGLGPEKKLLSRSISASKANKAGGFDGRVGTGIPLAFVSYIFGAGRWRELAHAVDRLLPMGHRRRRGRQVRRADGIAEGAVRCRRLPAELGGEPGDVIAVVAVVALVPHLPQVRRALVVAVGVDVGRGRARAAGDVRPARIGLDRRARRVG